MRTTRTRTYAHKEAAKPFIQELLPGTSLDWPKTELEQQIVWIVWAAFQLYELEYAPHHNIRNWKYPLDRLRSGLSFEDAGIQPWNILLDRAVSLALLHGLRIKEDSHG